LKVEDMMQHTENVFKRALVSGTVAGIATTAAAAFSGRRETGSYAAPINAVSHVAWGETAVLKNYPSLKYTLTGFLLNHGSAIFWAAFYERWFGRQSSRRNGPQSIARSLIGGATVAAGAYAVDYYLMPKRFTPGFEKRLSDKSLVMVFGMLALGLAARDLISRKAG